MTLGTKYPLSDSGKGIFTSCRRFQESSYYNLPFCCNLRPDTDIEKLKESLAAAVNAHPIFKTCVGITDSEPFLIRHDDDIPQISVHDAVTEDFESIKSRFVQPFDLLHGPLYRIWICPAKDSCHLLTDFHHLICDGRSYRIFLDHLCKAWQGEKLSPEFFVPTDGNFTDQAYFDSLLKNEDATILPYDLPNPHTNELAIESIELPYEVISEFCYSQGYSPSHLFMGSFANCLARFSGREKPVFFTMHHGRFQPEASEAVGMFIKTFPVILSPIKQKSAKQYLTELKSFTSDLWEHHNFSFIQLSIRTAIKVKAAFAYQSGIIESLDIPGNTAEAIPLPTHLPLIPFAITVHRHNNSFVIRADYDNGLYSSDYIRSFLLAMRAASSAIIRNPDIDCTQIPLLEAKERKEILEMSSGEQISIDSNGVFLDLFREQVQKRPGNIAVCDDSSSISYGELDSLSSRLARLLLEKGLTRGGFVAIMLNRKKEYISVILAVMKAGGAFLPIDTDYPPQRIESILKDSKPDIIITQESLLHLFPNSEDNRSGYIVLEDFLLENPQDTDKALPLCQAGDRAYMIYTSGSTGTPKGVIISHKSLYSCTLWMANLFNLSEEDRITAHTNFCFDGSNIDIFPTLAGGARLYILSQTERLSLNTVYQYILDNKITGAFFTTSFATELLHFFKLPLRYLGLGGERCQGIESCDFPVYNLFGPTEFTIASSYYTIAPHNKTESIPIGRPVPLSYSYVLGPNMELLPSGVQGELYLSGTQIALGYWNREDLSKSIFLPNPFSNDPEFKQVYRSGDMVRWRRDGQLEYMGRRDGQVKIHGHRIETEEIERIIASRPGIMIAKVMPLEREKGIRQLFAWFTADQRIDTELLRTYLLSKLPDYMIPEKMVQIDAFSYTANGKIDTSKLVLPSRDCTNAVLPESENEKVLYKIVCKILGTDQFGVTDNLFDLGIDSITAMTITASARLEGLDVQMPDIYINKTIRKILNNTRSLFRRKYIPGKKWALVVSGASPAPVLDSLCEFLEKNYSLLILSSLEGFYPVKGIGTDFPSTINYLCHSLDEILRYYGDIPKIECFAGHCLGGEIAYCLAAQQSLRKNYLPEVILFNSFANRDLLPSYPHRQYQKPEETMAMQKALETQELCSPLLKNRSLPDYNGHVKLFYATEPAYNIDSPLLPSPTEDLEFCAQCRNFFTKNPENWKTIAPNIEIIPIAATHWTLVSTLLEAIRSQKM